MKTQRRWLNSVIAASRAPQPALPFERGARRRPASLAESPKSVPAAVTAPRALAAR
jgi:hypothetical protein